MLLHLLRHAHAGDWSTWEGADDRPTADRQGSRRSRERLGRFLRGQGFRPDVIVTSPKVRAAQTAEIVAGLLEVRSSSTMRLGRRPRPRDARGHPASTTAPRSDRSSWVTTPTSASSSSVLCGAAGIPMRKGAFARIEVDRPLAPGAGTLRWLVPPDLLKPER